VAPTDRFVPRFAAEPPQEGLPYGRWAHSLSDAFYRACDDVEADEELGDPGEITFYPDRTYAGRTYVPATAPTSSGLELYGHVSFVPAPEGGEPSDILAMADYTAETAERNPDWQLDLCDDVIGAWRGEEGRIAQVTLIWGRPLRAAGAIVTAELADLAVDQCVLLEDRFTLISPDDYGSDTVEVKLFDTRGREVARESLYEEEDEGGE
jgi:hypothetical protein